MLDEFSAAVGGFYSPDHAAAEHITAADRYGVQQKFPLLTLSVAALDSGTMGAADPDAIAQLLAQLKKVAKTRPGNSLVLRSGERLLALSPPLRAAEPSADTPAPIEEEDELLPMSQM